jgi:hypothetical protein
MSWPILRPRGFISFWLSCPDLKRLASEPQRPSPRMFMFVLTSVHLDRHLHRVPCTVTGNFVSGHPREPLRGSEGEPDREIRCGCLSWRGNRVPNVMGRWLRMSSRKWLEGCSALQSAIPIFAGRDRDLVRTAEIRTRYVLNRSKVRYRHNKMVGAGSWTTRYQLQVCLIVYIKDFLQVPFLQPLQGDIATGVTRAQEITPSSVSDTPVRGKCVSIHSYRRKLRSSYRTVSSNLSRDMAVSCVQNWKKRKGCSESSLRLAVTSAYCLGLRVNWVVMRRAYQLKDEIGWTGKAGEEPSVRTSNGSCSSGCTVH